MGRNIIFARGEHNFITPDFAPIAENHILLCTNHHYKSFAQAPAEVRAEAANLIQQVVKFFARHGRQTLIGEHGSGDAGTSACFEHAHLHIVSVETGQVAPRVSSIYTNMGGACSNTLSLDQIGSISGHAYNALSWGGGVFSVWLNDADFFPQFFRFAVAEALESSKESTSYLWQLSINRDKAIETVNKCVDAFEGSGVKRFRIKSSRKIEKLVRDYVPKQIADSGEIAMYHRISGQDFTASLATKVIEELHEFLVSPSAEEAADLYEAFLALIKCQNINIESIFTAAHKKEVSSGKFEEAVFLDNVLRIEIVT